MKWVAASSDELPAITRIFDEARAFQRAQGFIQWKDGYPSRATLLDDLEKGHGFLFTENGTVAGYVALSAGKDADYERLSHIWKHAGLYGTVHRLALGDAWRGRHLAQSLFDTCESHLQAKGCTTIRIDTGVENVVMQRILERRGYENRGTHDFFPGKRIAFEKSLEKSFA